MRLFGAVEKDSLLNDAKKPRCGGYPEDFVNEILGLWKGNFFQQLDTSDLTLDGHDVDVELQLSVMPGYESSWAKVQIARIDITERKKAEKQLRHAGTHDPVTNLHNRIFFEKRLSELQASSIRPISFLMMDLDGLKTVNDTDGHTAGDSLLKRMGEILTVLAHGAFFAARLGGDEFVLVMPGAEQTEAQLVFQTLERLVRLDNQSSERGLLSVSIGAATTCLDEPLSNTVDRADKIMYRAKASYYDKRVS